MSDSPNPSRRRFLQAAGGASAVALTPARAAEKKNEIDKPAYLFLNPAEAAFIEAATARLIPKDETGPGALEAGVPAYIDKQLAGAWGAGARLYRSGPWREGIPGQGYQLPFTPAELFRNALQGVDTNFTSMKSQDQDAYLHSLQDGKVNLGQVPSKIFFQSLLEVTIEGFFSDPAYGGNRGMVAWKMIGFPGAYADFYEHVDKHGVAYVAPPTSLAEDARGQIHVMKHG